MYLPAPGSPECLSTDGTLDTDILLHGLEEHVAGQIVWRRLKQATLRLDEKEVQLNDCMPLNKTYAKSICYLFTMHCCSETVQTADANGIKWSRPHLSL